MAAVSSKMTFLRMPWAAQPPVRDSIEAGCVVRLYGVLAL